jgi:septal ring factor EnvC (AmiA/AmiB activator)
MEIKRWICAILLIPLFALAQSSTDLKELRSRISQEEKELQTLASQKSNTVKQIEALISKSYNERRIVTMLNQQIRDNNAQIKRLKAEEATLKKIAAAYEAQARKGIIFMTDNIGSQNAKVLFAGGDPVRIATTIELLDRVNSSLAAQIRNYVELSIEVAAVSQRIAAENSALAINRTERERSVKQHTQSQQQLSSTLKSIRQDEKAQREYIAMLKKEQDRINKALRESAKRQAYISSSPFAREKGKLPRPMQGRVIERYGEKLIPEAGVKIMHNGIKIAPTGDGRVSCIAEGRVVHIEYINGVGNIIIVQHDKEYYSVYANMDEFNVSMSEVLQKNSTIGRIDVDFKADSSYLYFEIRQGEKALDPQQWIVK